MALAIRCPTRRTISASLFTVGVTTLFWLRKLWYCVVASDCSVDSGNNESCLRPVTALVEQPATAHNAANPINIFFMRSIFQQSLNNCYTRIEYMKR